MESHIKYWRSIFLLKLILFRSVFRLFFPFLQVHEAVWPHDVWYQQWLSPPQTAQTVLVVVVVFCLSWLPHHVVHLWVEFGSFPLNQASFVFRMVAHCLAYSNSSVNPIIYAFLSENFRNSYRQVFWCRVPSKCPVNDTRELRSKVETAPSTNISVTYKGPDSQISKMLWRQRWCSEHLLFSRWSLTDFSFVFVIV